MAIIKGFTFDGINSLDYGIAITEDGTYSAPQRDVEFVDVPGRNGTYILDNGRYSNIELTYHCVIGNADQEDFNDKVAAFRSEMLSRVGYYRLSDDFHPDEFRIATCVNGIDFTNTPRVAGKFDIVFNCKPQRFLTSGETPIEITSGDAIVNPTLFPSKPLFEVEGYGRININNSTVSIQDSPIGKITVSDETVDRDFDLNIPYKVSTFYATDAISYCYFVWEFYVNIPDSELIIADYVTNQSSGISSIRRDKSDEKNILFVVAFDGKKDGTIVVGAGQLDQYISYEVIYLDSSDVEHTVSGTISLGLEFSISGVTQSLPNWSVATSDMRILSGVILRAKPVVIDSTYSSLGNPLYLDLESGQAYKYENGEYISVNDAVWLGADLPVLGSGMNNITFANTVHDLKIVPRWWII